MFVTDFQKTIGKPLQLNEVLSKYTTIGIGGPAEYFYTVTNKEELKGILSIANEDKIPITVLGGGSNVIIADEGVKGLVIRNQIKDFEIIEALGDTDLHRLKDTAPRLNQLKNISAYPADALQPSFTEQDEVVYVRIGAGWKMNDLIGKTLQAGLTGLEWFGGIPGSVGGAIYMNMHGGQYFWSNFVQSVEVLNEKGQEKTYLNPELRFDYDYSLFHRNQDIITIAMIRLYKGKVDQAKKIFQYWASQKTLNQPQKTAGCIFQNLTEAQKDSAGLPTSSIGYMIDKVLGLKGKQIGGAKISTKHAAFIENVGGATAKDVKELIQLVEESAKKKLGIELSKEVEFIG